MRNWLLFVMSAAVVVVVGLDLVHLSILLLATNVRAVLWSMAFAGGTILAALLLPTLALALALRPFREPDDEERGLFERVPARSGIGAAKPAVFFE
jgi:hypothetical protein